ncbi:MAG: AmmeMemoRadiSam system protein B [FCB group bacterium]|nr:AmmeMemoRadiSam system protein B [FCB group bacterium]
MESFLRAFTPPENITGDLIGALTPHAGWVYSGGVAARTIACLATTVKPETALIFGADHTGVWRHSLYPDGAWQTPLGPVDIDEELAADLAAKLSAVLVADRHAHKDEHSIEVILPMLQYFWPGIRIVPIIVRPDSDGIRLGSGIGSIVNATNKKVVFLATTDLTHYGTLYGFMPAGIGAKGLQWMRDNDKRMVDCLCAADAGAVLREAEIHGNACGAGAAAALISAVNELGRGKGYLVEYATSHGSDPPEAFTYGVGYAGIVY